MFKLQVPMCITDCSSEMLDKVEPSTVADGYGLSVAFVCMLEIVKSIQSLVHPVSDSTTSSSRAPDVPSSKPAVESVGPPDRGIDSAIILVAEACVVILCTYY